MKNWRLAVADLVSDFSEGWCNDRRKEYLKERMADEIMSIWELQGKYEEYKQAHKNIDMVLIGERIKASATKILKDQSEILAMKSTKKPDITPDMIERAKTYPFDRLVEFKNRSAMCPFHEGQSPALRYYPDKNVAYCFACSRGFDTISWIRELEGKTFQEAVRQLQ